MATATDVRGEIQKEISRCQTSRLLQCFRAIGMIVDDVPIVWYSMGKESFATASLGKSFVVYKCDKLTPVLVSPQLPKKIRALEVVAKKQITFTACGRDILVWKRVQHIETLSGHQGTIKQLLCVGNVLFALDDAREIRIWDIESMELINVLTCSPGFSPSIIMHPATYLNKILIGSEEGALQLWNIRTMTCLFTFHPRGKLATPSMVTSLTQSPAVDVVGVGYADGTVLMLHLALDQLIMQFHQTQGRVTALTFRTDTSADAPIVATGTGSGDIALWNLSNKRLEAIIPHAHEGAITSLVFLQNEPLLLTTGVDNSIKLWIFDQVSVGSARLLKSREGHHGPPTRIRYYGSNTLATMADGADGTSCQILSSGQDRAFRVFHTAREQQSKEMAQGALLKVLKRSVKLPPITQFYAMETRERDWSNVITCHENEGAAYVWRFEHRTIHGKRILRQYDPSLNRVTPGSAEALRQQQTHANCVTISSCGHYALVGSIGGAIFRYNMQSGEKRGSYPTAATPKPDIIRGLVLPGTTMASVKEDTSACHAHEGPVSGVVVDALNTLVISGGMDGKLKFWDFRTHQLVYEMNLSKTSAAINQLELHHDSNLLAVSCDDQVVRIVDIYTHKLVRRFTGHTHRLTDLQFSRDGRWLFTSSADATMRVWDLPTAKCIDWVKFQKPVTSLAISPTGEFIATTHVGQLGLYLWANRSYFLDVLVDAEPKTPVLLDMPVAVNEGENENTVGSDIVHEETMEEVRHEQKEKENKKENTSVNQLEASLITLSTAPHAYWSTLFNLELIKKRNKPIVPPKAPEKAPFFLQTARKDDVHPTFVPVTKVQKTTHESNKEDEPKMEGWGVDENDDTWGPEEDDQVEIEKTPVNTSRLFKSSGMISARCKLAQLLMEAAQVEDENQRSLDDQSCWNRQSRFATVIRYLQTLSASAVDVEFQTLCMGEFDTEGLNLLDLFLQCLEEEMATRCHFQLLQAYLNRFLKLYDHLFVDNAMFLKRIDALCQVQTAQWEHLQQLLHNNLCLVQYFSKVQM